MTKVLGILGALGAGAVLMYLFDPERGRTRRALVRDKAVGMSNDAKDAFEKKAKHLSNRAKGFVHDAKSLVPGGPGERDVSAEAGV